MTHPDVCDAKIDDNDRDYYSKEVHFFDKFSAYRYEKGPQFYCSRFTACNIKNKHPVADAEWIKKALHVDSFCIRNWMLIF